MSGARLRKNISNTIIYIILIVMSIIWLIPIVWLVLHSFREEGAVLTYYYFPKKFTLANFVDLFENQTYNYIQWFKNTLFVSVFTCIISTMLNLCTSYVMSRFRFKARKPFLNIALILGMFPGFMSMVAIYYVLKSVGMTGNLWALVIVYSAGAGLGFYIAKGFFDTIPKVLDEAARIDGASNAKTFFSIILPLSKPIIVYTSLMAFMGPWCDFIFAKVILGTNSNNFTVAVGLYEMTISKNAMNFFKTFCAGSVFVAVPITILFIIMQRFYVAGVTGGAVKG